MSQTYFTRVALCCTRAPCGGFVYRRFRGRRLGRDRAWVYTASGPISGCAEDPAAVIPQARVSELPIGVHIQSQSAVSCFEPQCVAHYPPTQWESQDEGVPVIASSL